MSKKINKNEPKTIMQKLMDRKREELLERITIDISFNKIIDLSNNIQAEPNIKPETIVEKLTENTINITNEKLLKNKIDLLQKIRKNCIQLNLYHNSRYHYYRILLFTIFRIPLILLSGLNSFFAVGMQSYIKQSSISLINALLSLFCGVLTGIEILLNLQKRMENELDSYKKYYKLSVEIYKEIQVYEKGKDVDTEKIDKILNRVYNEYQSNILSGNAITVYNRIYTDVFEDLEDNNEYKYYNTNNLITNLYYAINHPCSICGVSTSRNMCLNLRDCLCCIKNKTNTQESVQGDKIEVNIV
jgi:hypothetical protein